MIVSSEPPDTATVPETARDLIGEVWDGNEKSGVRVRVSVECFRVLSLNPQMNRSYEPATKLISADFFLGFFFKEIGLVVLLGCF